MTKLIALCATLSLATACKKKEEAAPAPKPTTAGSAAAMAGSAAAMAGSAAAMAGSAAAMAGSAAAMAGSAAAEPPPAVDFAAGQSTGADTSELPSTDKTYTWRNTLVDKEVGATVTCPIDRTWHCKLGPDKKWVINDMSANQFAVRVGIGKDAAEVLANEIAYAKSILPVTKEASREGDSVVLDVDPDPTWVEKVPRSLWISVKDVGGKLFACHGWGSTAQLENSAIDYKDMCDSLAAPAA
ncbi:MAG: hypothetical protein R2939_10385 [Kofleriaceae bacterium]